VSSETQELLAFVRQLPVGPAYAPIYAKGQVFGKHQDVSKGKAPHENSHHTVMSPADVALLIERQPEVFKAVGLFTGIRSGGLVILDVDANLASLRKKWGETLDGAPVVTSTKKNAAKFIFRVPEDQRSRVKGISGRVTGQGYEVLWGMQGVIAGEYPGSSDGKAPEGFYALQGDLSQVPEAPEWLLAEMRAAKDAEAPAQGLIKNRKGLDFSGRTEDELFDLVQDCLSVLPHLGRGTEDYWWSVGAMIAEALPNEKGLMLWSSWSAEDPAFEDDWKNGNPCEAKWPHILKRAGRAENKGLGSLIFLADQYDAERQRFRESSRTTLGEVEKDRVQRFQAVGLSHDEIIRRATAAMKLENPSEVQHTIFEIAQAAGYRDPAAIVRLLIADQEYRRGSQGGSLKEIFSVEEQPIEYLIPDLLPKPGTLLMHGRGGCGKTMAVMTLAKHIARGIPFSVRGAEVPVEQGKVLWLNGDQNSRRIRKQFADLDFTADDPVVVQNKVSMLWYPWFIQQIEEHRPKLVVWDSVTACMRGSAYDQNKAEYAEPIYWYSAENGESFPATTIVFIHHAAKSGDFRGTSALQDAVDESWGIKRPEKSELERVGASARLITIGKSREGNEGKQLILRQKEDLTFSLQDLPPVDGVDSASPASIIDRVLQRLRTKGVPMTKAELNADPLLGGSVSAISKSLQRLVDRGLVVVEGDRSSKRYLAVLARRGGGGITCPKEEEVSTGATSQEMSCPDLSQVVPSCPKPAPGTAKGQVGTKRDKLGQLKSSELLQRSGSDSLGQQDTSIFTREESEADRTRQELNQMLEDADIWS
jgi:hypothetical protein